jgi:hypothetical protein
MMDAVATTLSLAASSTGNFEDYSLEGVDDPGDQRQFLVIPTPPNGLWLVIASHLVRHASSSFFLSVLESRYDYSLKRFVDSDRAIREEVELELVAQKTIHLLKVVHVHFETPPSNA